MSRSAYTGRFYFIFYLPMWCYHHALLVTQIESNRNIFFLLFSDMHESSTPKINKVLQLSTWLGHRRHRLCLRPLAPTPIPIGMRAVQRAVQAIKRVTPSRLVSRVEASSELSTSRAEPSGQLRQAAEQATSSQASRVEPQASHPNHVHLLSHDHDTSPTTS